MAEEERIIPASRCIYTTKKGTIQKHYYASLMIQHPGGGDDRWKVHLGDVIGFSTEHTASKGLTQKYIEGWQPKHLQKSSPHWKIGLVISMAHVLNKETGEGAYDCEVELLEKALDTPVAPAIRNTFRPYSRKQPRSQLPHLLLRTFQFHSIHPATILPVKITMVTDQRFKTGFEWDEEDKFVFEMHCPYKLVQAKGDGKVVHKQDASKDAWVELNHSFFNKKKSKQASQPDHTQRVQDPVPLPLQAAWSECNQIQGDDGLIMSFIEGFRSTKQSKYQQFLKFKNQQVKEQERRHAEEKEEEERRQREARDRKRARAKSPTPTASKRVRIEESKNSTSIAMTQRRSKTPPRKATVKPIIRKPGMAQKSKSSRSKKQSVRDTTPSTKSTSTISGSESDDIFDLSKQQHETQIECDAEYLVHSGKHQGQPCAFYERVELVHESKTTTIWVGQVVAVSQRKQRSTSRTDMEPFGRPWGIAHVVSLYQGSSTNEWNMHIRWLLRFHECSPDQCKSLRRRKGFDPDDGLLETMTLETCPVQAILPATINVTSKAGKLPKNMVSKSNTSLWFQCRYLLREDEKIVQKADWNEFSIDNYDPTGPYQRAIECKGLHKRVTEKYWDVLQARAAHEEESESEMEDESVLETQVFPVNSQPMYENWGNKFHECVRVEVDKESLHPDFVAQVDQWTVKVGYVVPVAYESNQPGRRSKKKASHYPYVSSWYPAQIVSIYQDASDRWKFQVRWFNKYSDLLENQKLSAEGLNKDYVIFESEVYSHIDISSCFPGRIIMTSTTLDLWDVKKSSYTGLPLIPKFCSRMCVDEELFESADWTGYDLNISKCPGPILRGLLHNARNRSHRGWILMLSRYYKKYIQRRVTDDDEDMIRKWRISTSSDVTDQALITFLPKKMKIERGPVMHSDTINTFTRRQFVAKLQISLPAEYMAKPTKHTLKSGYHSITVNVGDVVCYYDMKAGQRTDNIFMQNMMYPWFPYKISWSYGQVLAIYNDRQEGQPIHSFVEIRHLYRPSEIQKHRPCIPPTETKQFAKQCEDVFESDFLKTIPVSSILGLAQIYLGHHRATTTDVQNALVLCRNKYFYHKEVGRFQPLYSSGFSPEAWMQQFIERGMLLSQLHKTHSGLKESLRQTLPRPMTVEGPGWIDRTKLQLGTVGSAFPTTLASESPGRKSIFFKAHIEPNWGAFVNSKALFQENDRDFTWEVKIGDFVAFRSDKKTANFTNSFPFVGVWSAGQIVSILDETREKSTSFEVLHLDVSTEVQLDETDGLRELIWPVAGKIVDINSSDLLGPIVCTNNSAIDWQHMPKKLPCALFEADEETRREGLVGALRVSKYHSEETRKAVLRTLGLERTNQSEQERSKKEREGAPSLETVADKTLVKAWTTTKANFVDVSNLRSFYDRVTMKRLNNSADANILRAHQGSFDWTIKRGDIVLVHCEGQKRYPFDCNWGEVVAIWKQFEAKHELEMESHATGKRDIGSIEAEIRWFYGRQDIVRMGGTNMDVRSNEVFETDDVLKLDDLSPILAPAKLLSSQAPAPRQETFQGAPIQIFSCTRFWSITRKALIPCGDSNGRLRRAKLYSRYVPKGVSLEGNGKLRTLETSMNTASKQMDPRERWVDSARQVIAKLNLKEASKGVYEKGQNLIGREKELSKLLSFFRGAIRGEPGPGGVRSSIFLAGPPGVGKTACIRAAISKLQIEKIRGDVPNFEFIPMNGMEMRHPFEAYVKLLEALTGTKHVGSHEKACERLEFMFTNPKALQRVEGRSRDATIVLLDEIDYLVTEKQSVLYNFFDWPKRAAALPNGRRLIVIGISNTLNLAEQLMPSVRSRVGSERIAFKSYSVKDAAAILTSKINEASPDEEIFDKDAILFAAKKTAALSGDIRKAFQICRAATEIVIQRAENDVEKENKDSAGPLSVRIGDVQKASRRSFDAALVTAVSISTPFQALILLTLASLYRTTGREVGGFDVKDVMAKMEALVGSSGDSQLVPPPSFGETLQLLSRLSENNLVTLYTPSSSSNFFRTSRGGSGGAWPMASLAVDEHTVVRGLKLTAFKDLAEKTLPSML